MIYAPILITTLDRYECLKKCIESLQQNNWANKTDLFISVDFPPSDKYLAGYNKIKEYLEHSVEGFKNVNIFFQNQNLGALKNSKWLIDLVGKDYDRYIFLEDDNELAPSFIEFCDKGLHFFENDNSIFAINATDYVWCGKGYTPIVKKANIDENNVEKRQMIFHASAYWVKKRNMVNDFCELIEKNEGLCDVKSLIKIYKKSKCLFYDFLSLVGLQNQQLPWHEHKIVPIDFIMDIYMILNDMYVINPIEPLQRDLGVDGNGENYVNAFQNANDLKNRSLNLGNTFEYRLLYTINKNNFELILHDKYMNLSVMDRFKIILKYTYKYLRKECAKEKYE